MKWKRIDNSIRVQPDRGEYNEWKPEIAEVCEHRCVYCGIHESRYGGLDNYHVDHFRPKSFERFSHLVRTIANLYLACAICNRFKGNDWPADPAADHSIPAYPDPGECAYCDLFNESLTTFRLTGKFPAATYVIERLGLNRPQLLVDRRMDYLLARCSQAEAVYKELEGEFDGGADPELAKKVFELAKTYSELIALLRQVFEAVPYHAGDQTNRR